MGTSCRWIQSSANCPASEANLGEFADWADAERIVLNLHRVYADRASRELDLMAAITDTTAWLGGPMHTSV